MSYPPRPGLFARCVAAMLMSVGVLAVASASEGNPPIAPSVVDPALLTPAARALRKIPLEKAAEAELPLSAQDRAKLKPHLTLDEIRIIGEREPEDVVRPKRPPMLAFRDRLARERPRTPAETLQLSLCVIGLCGGIPPEIGFDERQEIRTRLSTVQLQAMRGTLQ